MRQNDPYEHCRPLDGIDVPCGEGHPIDQYEDPLDAKIRAEHALRNRQEREIVLAAWALARALYLSGH